MHTTPRLTELDLRIKAGAALACHLSPRAGQAGTAGGARMDTALGDLSSISGIERRWPRRFGYFVLTVAIAIPWILFLADQLPG